MSRQNLQDVATGRNVNPHYKGRVRTGCLTCRSKKVKCDEERPVCMRCRRLNRACIYNTNKPLTGFGSNSRVDAQTTSLSLTYGVPLPQERSVQPVSPFSIGPSATRNGSPMPVRSHAASVSAERGLLSTHSSMENDAMASPAALSMMVSQDIYLCTTIDRLAAEDVHAHLSFHDFLLYVNPPLITNIDLPNWNHFKLLAAKLGIQHQATAAALEATQAFYKAQANNVSTNRALKKHAFVKAAFNRIAQDHAEDFDTVLVVMLLLILFEVLAFDELQPSLASMDHTATFVHRLSTFCQEKPHSLLSLRIIAWLRVLHAAGRRGGNTGVMPKAVLDHLPYHGSLSPLSSLGASITDARSAIYDTLYAPLFEFCLEVETLSARIPELSHYHRSRTTGADQEEVFQQMSGLKDRLHVLWHDRPKLLHLTPAEVRKQLTADVASPLITIIGLCIATYHTELVEIGRTLSDPPLAAPDAKVSMSEIRSLIEGDWNVYRSDGRLHSGYLRPLFLYSIESLRPKDTQWAVDRLREIRDPLCRSDFFATFAEQLSAAQREKADV